MITLFHKQRDTNKEREREKEREFHRDDMSTRYIHL